MEDILLRGVKPKAKRKLMVEEPEYDIEGEALPPLNNFEDLKTKVPFGSPLAVQRVVIPYLLNNVNISVRAFTGSGKTLAYCLPLIEMSRRSRVFGVILVPTKVLVGQIFRVVNEIKYKKLEVRAICMNGERTVSIDEDERGVLVEKDLSSDGDCSNMKRFLRSSRLLIITPDALLKIADCLKLRKATHLVVDEADFLINMSSMDVFASVLKCFKMKKVHFSCFSATMNSEVEEVINSVGSITRISVKSKKSIDHEFVFGTDEKIKHIALQQIIANGIEAPTLIFVKDEPTAERLSTLLKNSAVYREEENFECNGDAKEGSILDDFRLKKIWYLFTTDVLSRGVDFYNVKSVINYDIPATKTQFVHRVGRVNRNCQGQKVYTIYSSKDFKDMDLVVEFLEENNCFVPEHIKRIIERSR